MASNHSNGLQPGPDPDPDLWDPLRLNRSGISWNIHVVFLPSLTESLVQVVVSQEPGLEKEPESQGRGGLQTFKAHVLICVQGLTTWQPKKQKLKR